MSASRTDPRHPSVRARLATAGAAGALAALVSVEIANMLAPLGKTGSDFDQLWVAARALLTGQDPYVATGAFWHWGLSYPLSTVVLTLPLGALPLATARAIFTGGVVLALAFACTRDRWWRLTVLLSGACVAAVMVSQWSPLLLAGVFIPGLSFFWIVKPTLAVALWIGWPYRIAAGGALIALAASLALVPEWPRDWIATVGDDPHLAPAIMRPFGWLLLLALIRWRRPEARFLAAIACIPHTEAWPDALLLFAVVQSFREATLLTLSTLLGLALGWRFVGAPTWPGDMARFLDALWPFILATAYLPALMMVLRRPNVGVLPFPPKLVHWLSGPRWVARRPIETRHR